MRVGFAWAAGIFIDAFGVPLTVVTGGVMFCSSVLASTFATELYQVYLLRGVLSSVGSGILFATPIHCLALSFDRKIAFATGIAISGSGFGAVVFGYAGKAVIATADWRWYYRMVAAVGLFSFPAAFLLYIKPHGSPSSESSDVAQLGSQSSCGRAMSKLRKGAHDLYDSLRKGKVLYRDPHFILVAICWTIYAFGYFFPLISSVSIRIRNRSYMCGFPCVALVIDLQWVSSTFFSNNI